MSNNGATTTQKQSIPTALFDKMFGKDKGMPGRNELLSTMQDRSESSAKYKVSDRVKFVDEDCVISGVTETLTGRWRYNIERNKQTKWESDPKTMLIAAVEREGSRIVFPDSVTGLVCIDELEAHDGIIDGEVM